MGPGVGKGAMKRLSCAAYLAAAAIVVAGAAVGNFADGASTLALILAPAGAAAASAVRAVVRIRLIVRMARIAVRLGRVHCRQRSSAQRVLPGRDYLQVRQVRAAAVDA